MRDKRGKDQQTQTADAAVLAEVERMETLSTIQLATEVMTRGFGPGSPADTVPPRAPGASVRSVLKLFDPEGSSDGSLHRRLYDLVAESVQALEHASLVRPEPPVGQQQGLCFYTPTRLGRAALGQDAVERVLRGESLASG